MARSRRTRSTSKPAAQGQRAKVVWLSLMGAMTALGGLLLVLDPGKSNHAGGSAIPALAATGTTDSLERVFTAVRSPLATQRWKAIVIHHSGSNFASPDTIAAQHLRQGLKKMGHHFVIGNGSGMADGEIHVAERWLMQEAGAHASGKDGKWFNQHAISICLVGNGDQRGFSRQQLAKLDQLVASLQAELNIPANRVYLHSDIAPISDPGRNFPAEDFRAALSQR